LGHTSCIWSGKRRHQIGTTTPLTARPSFFTPQAPAEGVFLATQAGTTFLVVAPPLEGTAEDDRFSEHRIGLDHLAFAVEDRAELDSLVERPQAAGVDTKGVETDVVLGKEYVAFRDPDNVQLEAYMV